MKKEPVFLIIDLFCGAGGFTEGVEQSGIVKVIIGVNHDEKAIESHTANHPETIHFVEDIRTVKMKPLKDILRLEKSKYPNALVILHASLECTNFSKAKGGQPRKADSRTLADHLDRYTIALNPDYITIENVVEFMSWGPLDENGKPVSKKSGYDYTAWRNRIKTYGYYDKWRELNSANYGAYTSRNRLFGVFAKHGLPILFPEPTHIKDTSRNTLPFHAEINKWKPVREVLDFSDEGNSIFGRKKEMSAKTIEVIYKGMLKAISEGNNTILFKYYGNGDNLNSIDQPAGTLTTKDRFAKISFIFRQYKPGFTTSINEPIGALPTVPKASIVSFIMNKSHGGHTTSVNSPSPVIVARQDKAPLYLIKALMDEKGIIDIKHRMLRIHELLKIQGFPSNYQLFGTQADQKKFIGNSVEVNTAKALINALGSSFINTTISRQLNKSYNG